MERLMRFESSSLSAIENNIQRNKQVILFLCFLASCSLILFNTPIGPVAKYVAIPALLIILFNYPIFDYLLFPLSFMDNAIGTVVFGRITFLWFYLLLLTLKHIRKKNLYLKVSSFIILAMASMYFLWGYSHFGLLKSIRYMLIIFCSMIISRRHKKNPDLLSLLLFVIYSSAILEAITLSFGLSGMTIEATERVTGIGWTDPNYTSSICLYGLCALINRSFDTTKQKLFQFVGCLLIVFGVFRSGSRSGLLAIGIVLIIRIMMINNMKARYSYVITLAIVVVVTLIFSRSGLVPLSKFNNIVERWKIVINALQSRNFDVATTHRLPLLISYWDFFINQNPIRVLFGGVIVGSESLLSQFGRVSHNVYMDYLLAFGFVGTIIMAYGFLKRTLGYFTLYRQTENRVYLALVEIKLSMLIIGVTLSMLTVEQWWFLAIV